MTRNVTIFKNIKETSTPFHREVSKILDRIKQGASKEVVKKIRLEKRKNERNELKKLLPAICFSGTFNRRADSSIIQHSGLICLDFDGYEKHKELLADKDLISKYKFVYSVFISPSGNGLKVLVKIPTDIENHTKYFNSLEKHFNSPYFDKTSKNISRVCYESYDPLIYINEESVEWDKIEEHEYVEISVNTDNPTIAITDENKIVEILMKWWTKKYPMVDGQRNHNLFIIAMAFNEYGINKNLAQYVLNQYSSPTFTSNEIQRTIDSAYAQTNKFQTKYYEDEDRVNQIKNKVRRGATKNEIRHQFEGSNIDGDIIDSIINEVENENQNLIFWTKSDKGVVKIVHFLFKQFLEDNGYYKFNPENSKNYVFVKVTNNLIDHTSEKEIKDFVLDYLIQLEDMSIYNYFADNTRYFKEEFLTLISSIEVYFVEDTKSASYLYYKNCALKVTPTEITPIDYLDLGGYVWKDHVIERNFNICDSYDDCDYKKFILNISNKDPDRDDSVRSAIGFLMHGYKNTSFCPAIILYDEEISDNPEGGTGKGLFMNALSMMKKLVVIDGKSFTFERAFAYQLVSADTQILCFDDVKKNFEFERLFSVITEGLTLEKKNKDAIKIPFSKSPKVAITTNYSIKGVGNSFARRKFVLEFRKFYSKDYTPEDEFGKLMFSDWDDDDWVMFDNYMIGCLQNYLTSGLIESESVNKKRRDLISATNTDFVSWCGRGKEINPLLVEGIKIYKQDLYIDFTQEYPQYSHRSKDGISRQQFYSWVALYAEYKTGVKPEEDRDHNGRWIRMRSKHDLEFQSAINF
jgi:hypothetical protein